MFDVIIVGGGMVGASVAVKLAQAGMQVAVIEKQTPPPFTADSKADLRVSSLNLRSEAWLQQLGAWQALIQMRVCPYQRLQASEGSAVVTFTAEEIGRSHLGHIVENNLVQLALWQQFNERITVFCPDGITAFTQTAEQAELTLESGKVLQARLVIAADGARSQLRELAGIGTSGWQYQQACLVAHVKTPYPQQDITWQQFTESGPRAFLPLPGAEASLVWYDDIHKVKQLAGLSPALLQQQIMQHFPEQLGQIEVLSSSWFPLGRMHANRYVCGRLVLAGDAAHTINPLAGQGVNLGFADAEKLTSLLTATFEQAKDFAAPQLLKTYERSRRPANLLMMSTMDGFYQAFSSSLPPVRWLRQQSLQLASHAGVLKKLVSRYAVGAVD
ncbi:FAD-dependent oxidoreductase [Chromatiaceae bacterium AAb-1]|nr:FAD-dependent oxidoreductase [Chromatiaceae bacterium AAb-1]